METASRIRWGLLIVIALVVKGDPYLTGHFAAPLKLGDADNGRHEDAS